MHTKLEQRTVYDTNNSEFRGHGALKTSDLFGIFHILTGKIIQTSLKYLTATYAWLKGTKRTRYSTVSIQILLRSLVISL